MHYSRVIYVGENNRIWVLGEVEEGMVNIFTLWRKKRRLYFEVMFFFYLFFILKAHVTTRNS